MSIHIASLAGIAVAGLLLAAAPASATVLNLTATLTGAAEVPANDSAGTGTLEATYDDETMTLHWDVLYKDLTGDATAAHFHGPATTTQTAPPVIPITSSLTSPITGEMQLTTDQATQLQDGVWYFNIHTAAHPDGEIRGQVVKAPQ